MPRISGFSRTSRKRECSCTIHIVRFNTHRFRCTGNVPYRATIKGIADIFVGLTSVDVVTTLEALNEILYVCQESFLSAPEFEPAEAEKQPEL